MPISALILKEKAIEIAKELNIEDFGGRNGCLKRFKDRHCLSFKTISVEVAAVEGSFYRLLLDKTLSFTGDKCTSGKASKQRLALLFGANMCGKEKLKPPVIGKSKKPRFFKNIKSLPVEYEANSNAWMTTTIWETHIRKQDSQFSRQERNVVIIVDNCTAHNQPEHLKAIEIVFLPPNVTALLQALDQGIIRDFKRKYKKMLVKDLIKVLDKNETLEVSVLDAIN
ncbi:Tigger transposable element-derived protein 4 [Araneus ventricosus]|uniref:Tigger transposable element-derived protein 4 n=1 Tax=Araneus ventricosus TaxID=182803 RepID=A0A4Y2JUL9_ARAVE|nr:Tigger transposable element-derived protein 4 [Araneus ventricosus]